MAGGRPNGKTSRPLAQGGKVNIHSIAAEAAVSIATVSRVINEHASVSPEVRKRVQAAISRLAYRPNIIARSLRTQQSGSFGVIIPNIGNAHFADVVRALQDEAERNGYTTLMANSDNQLEREQAAIRTLLERRVDGIALVSCSSDMTPALHDAIKAGTPIVAMDRRIDDEQIDQVVIDTRQGTRDAVLHLAAQGRRRIAFIAGPARLWTAREKRLGYNEGLKRARLKYDPALVFPGDYTFASGERQAAALLAAEPLPDGIVVANNLMAFGAMRTLLRSRLRIPRDLAFIGVDDTIWTDTIKPSVSVVSQPTTTMGRETVRLLMRRIQDGATRRGEMVVLPAGLVLRESTEGEV